LNKVAIKPTFARCKCVEITLRRFISVSFNL
jgi:hypothetical protein